MNVRSLVNWNISARRMGCSSAQIPDILGSSASGPSSQKQPLPIYLYPPPQKKKQQIILNTEQINSLPQCIMSETLESHQHLQAHPRYLNRSSRLVWRLMEISWSIKLNSFTLLGVAPADPCERNVTPLFLCLRSLLQLPNKHNGAVLIKSWPACK